MAKRLALIQADTRAKRGAPGDIYELEPLVLAEESCTRSAIGKLVGELAQQGHLLVRHNKGLKCKACNVYRADRQFIQFLEPNSLCSEAVCGRSHLPIQKQEKAAQHVHRRFGLWQVCFPIGQSGHPRVNVTLHTLNNSVTYASPSQVGEQCDGSRYVSAQSHLRGMDGKSRRLDSAKGVVITPVCVAGPGAPLLSNQSE